MSRHTSGNDDEQHGVSPYSNIELRPPDPGSIPHVAAGPSGYAMPTGALAANTLLSSNIPTVVSPEQRLFHVGGSAPPLINFPSTNPLPANDPSNPIPAHGSHGALNGFSAPYVLPQPQPGMSYPAFMFTYPSGPGGSGAAYSAPVPAFGVPPGWSSAPGVPGASLPSFAPHWGAASPLAGPPPAASSDGAAHHPLPLLHSPYPRDAGAGGARWGVGDPEGDAVLPSAPKRRKSEASAAAPEVRSALRPRLLRPTLWRGGQGVPRAGVRGGRGAGRGPPARDCNSARLTAFLSSPGGEGKPSEFWGPRRLTRADVLSMPIVEAAAALSVSVSTLKSACRLAGFPRWPQRRIAGLRRWEAAALGTLEKTRAAVSSHNEGGTLALGLMRLAEELGKVREELREAVEAILLEPSRAASAPAPPRARLAALTAGRRGGARRGGHGSEHLILNARQLIHRSAALLGGSDVAAALFGDGDDAGEGGEGGEAGDSGAERAPPGPAPQPRGETPPGRAGGGRAPEPGAGTPPREIEPRSMQMATAAAHALGPMGRDIVAGARGGQPTFQMPPSLAAARPGPAPGLGRAPGAARASGSPRGLRGSFGPRALYLAGPEVAFSDEDLAETVSRLVAACSPRPRAPAPGFRRNLSEPALPDMLKLSRSAAPSSCASPTPSDIDADGGTPRRLAVVPPEPVPRTSSASPRPPSYDGRPCSSEPALGAPALRPRALRPLPCAPAPTPAPAPAAAPVAKASSSEADGLLGGAALSLGPLPGFAFAGARGAPAPPPSPEGHAPEPCPLSSACLERVGEPLGRQAGAPPRKAPSPLSALSAQLRQAGLAPSPPPPPAPAPRPESPPTSPPGGAAPPPPPPLAPETATPPRVPLRLSESAPAFSASLLLAAAAAEAPGAQPVPRGAAIAGGAAGRREEEVDAVDAAITITAPEPQPQLDGYELPSVFTPAPVPSPALEALSPPTPGPPLLPAPPGPAVLASTAPSMGRAPRRRRRRGRAGGGRGGPGALHLRLPRADRGRRGAHPAPCTSSLSSRSEPRSASQPLNRLIAKRIFGPVVCGPGGRLDLAPDGRAALEATRARAYDAVVLDLDMPRLTGHEAIREMRADEAASAAGPGAPPPKNIVAWRSRGLCASTRARCMAGGFSDALLKPCPTRILLSRALSPLAHRPACPFLAHLAARAPTAPIPVPRPSPRPRPAGPSPGPSPGASPAP
eukprot:tig00021590_g22771.t1